MKSGLAMLVGVGVLSLTAGIGSATAATRHYQRHAVHSHALQAPGLVATLPQSGNNPAKRYPTRQLADGAIKTGTLAQNGNNPAKRYARREIAANAAQSGTLPQQGNNPAKRYALTASR